mgnify:CR=1 FL=1
MKKIKKLINYPESFCLLIIFILFIIIEFRSGQFFTSNNLTDLLASYTVPGIMAMGSLIVFISGGLDISFPALCSLGGFITLTVFENFTGPVIVPFLFCSLVCGLLGLFNGAIIAKFKFAPLIVTLATEALFWGILHGILRAREISVLPPCFEKLQDSVVWIATNNETGISSRLPGVFLVFVGVVIVSSLLLRKTVYGRKLFAVGGNPSAAENVGINVFWIRVSAYIISGITAGVACLCRSCIIGNYHPNALYGYEYNVISMVVLGGCSLSGGRGSVIGTLFGVILIQTMNLSLTLMGVPTYWQKFCTGVIMIIGISYSAYRTMKGSQKLSQVMAKTDNKDKEVK